MSSKASSSNASASSSSASSSAAGLRWWWLTLLPPLLVPLLFCAVLVVGDVPLRDGIPHEAWRADRCTWACHNRGCHHAHHLPRLLAVDAFDAAVAGLYDVGAVFSADRGVGYGVANLVVFVGVWPLAMLTLFFVAVWQRRRLSSS